MIYTVQEKIVTYELERFKGSNWLFFRKLHGIKLKKCHDMYIGRNTKNEKFGFDNLVL